MSIFLNINFWNHFLTLEFTLNVDVIINYVTSVMCNERNVLRSIKRKSFTSLNETNCKQIAISKKFNCRRFIESKKNWSDCQKFSWKARLCSWRAMTRNKRRDNLWNMQWTIESAHFKMFKLFISSMCALQVKLTLNDF